MATPYYHAASSIEALFVLLRESNPDLPAKVNSSNVTVGTPSAITPVGNLNTQITLTAKEGAVGITGSITLRYRRLNLTSMIYNNSSTYNVIRKIYGSPNDLNLTTDVNPYSAQYRKKVAEKFGIHWSNADEFTSNSVLTEHGMTTSSVTLTASANNLCYTGSFIVTFAATNVQTIDMVWPNKVLADGILEWMDHPEIFYRLLTLKTTNELIASARSIYGATDTFSLSISASHQPFFDIVNAATGLSFDATKLPTESNWGLRGFGIQKVSPEAIGNFYRKNVNEGVLANTAPLKNYLAEKWSRLLMLDSLPTGWRTGTLIIPLIPYSLT